MVASGNTSNTSSAPTNAERSNNTNIQTYYNSENFGSTTRDNSYASLLFLGEDFPKVTPLEDQIVNEIISKLKTNE
ncbi:hypothetical protein F8M41_003823 [Gigaspora margarita]|uniref:Uncharacterized protein n=1 Tax=Gigaspora margarita TaxID=4874 RepID=A0A8H4ES29_GIGMA|nr:hypothetical protein F8M41_003823 [Gigaspora margarita]